MTGRVIGPVQNEAAGCGTRTDAVLSDGREIFYYDRAPGRAERSDGAPLDTRCLPPVTAPAEVRWEPMFGDYAVIAGHRQVRAYHPPAANCPLEPSRPGSPTEIPAGEYEVVVFENRFPPFWLDTVDHAALRDEAPFRSTPGVGRCEVICFSSDHHTPLSKLPPWHARLVIDALADRTLELARLDQIDYVFCFENRGEAIGATLPHPHGQIYGYPFVPPRFQRLAASLRSYRRRAGGCRQCAMLDAELTAGERIVRQNRSWVAYVPFAARWPYELRIVPRRHVPDLPALSDTERDELAELYGDVVGAFDRLFDAPAPYISGWQQAPVRRGRDLWHLAAEVFTVLRASDRLKYLAGSESGAGVWINDVIPEECAARLRAVSDDGSQATSARSSG